METILFMFVMGFLGAVFCGGAVAVILTARFLARRIPVWVAERNAAKKRAAELQHTLAG